MMPQTERLAAMGELEPDTQIRFICNTTRCPDGMRHFTAADGVKDYGAETRLDQLLRRPCRGCGKKRWMLDVCGPPSGLGGFGRHGHGGT